MTFEECAPGVLLAVLVIRQLRGKRLTVVGLCWPVGIVVVAAVDYLRPVPMNVVALVLIACGVVAGGGLGIGCAALTSIRADDDGALIARASGLAAALWIVGCLARTGFALYAEHGGGPAIVRFDAAHGLTVATWAAALLVMALAEVLGRTAVLAWRVVRLRGERRVGISDKRLGSPSDAVREQ